MYGGNWVIKGSYLAAEKLKYLLYHLIPVSGDVLLSKICAITYYSLQYTFGVIKKY